MHALALVVHVALALGVIGLVLIQDLSLIHI